MGDYEDDTNYWTMELENALLEDCTATDIYCITKGRQVPDSLRADVWQICLDVRDKGNQLDNFNLVYDLPNQSVLHQNCTEIISKLDNDDHDKISLVSDLETIVTFYCKTRNIDFDPTDQILELIIPLLTINVTKTVVYNLFESIRDTYIPNLKNTNVYHILRLLLLYHEPELCTLLDSKKIAPEVYASNWFKSLFASGCDVNVVIPMWDHYFQQSDAFFIFFLSLIMIINAKESIIAMKDEDRAKIVEMLTQMPTVLMPDDVGDFCSLAQYYCSKTPSSFRNELLDRLCKGLEGSTPAGKKSKAVSQVLCLPVTVHELLEAGLGTDSVRFFLVDCRPIDAYNAGRLPAAFHLDCDLLLHEPAAFQLAVQGLLAAQKQSVAAGAGGKHLCFLGRGGLGPDNDRYTHMVVAYFLQKNTRYVSLLDGGYLALHQYLDQRVDTVLQDHNLSKCEVCQTEYNMDTRMDNHSTRKQSNVSSTNVTPSSSGGAGGGSTHDFLGKLSAAMRTKSAEVRGRLIEYIVNPGAVSSSGHQEQSHHNQQLQQHQQRHVSSADRIGGKRYRDVAPVFSINDDQENVTEQHNLDEDSKEDRRESVPLASWLRSPEVLEHFPCQVVKLNGFMYRSHLLVTATHLIVLREADGHGMAAVEVRRPLSAIVKITAKKRHPDLITFKYGVSDGDSLVISDMDRFLIPNAERATKAVSDQILKRLVQNSNSGDSITN